MTSEDYLGSCDGQCFITSLHERCLRDIVGSLFTRLLEGQGSGFDMSVLGVIHGNSQRMDEF